MKKILVVALALVAAADVMAQTNAVLSRNAVGYVRRPIDGNQLDLMAVPFVRLDGAQSVVSNVFPTAADGSQAILWNKSSQAYVSLGRSKGSWGTGGSNSIPLGGGVFFRSPSGVNQTNYVMGEVPDQFTAPTTTVAVVAGVNMLASGYPVATAWTSTTLAAQLPDGSQFTIWNRTNGAYQSFGKSKGSWGSGSSVVLQPGDGFFARQPGGSPTINWNQAKPYTWP